MLKLVFPMYNEDKLIADTMLSVESWICSNYPTCTAYFVNDGSSDGTAAAAEKSLHECPHIKLIGYSVNKGKGHAVRYGILAACRESKPDDIILFTDCDLAYGLDIIKLFAVMKTDVAIGSRALHPDGYAGYSFLRRLMSKTYLNMIRFYAHFKYTDSQSGIKAFRADAAEKIFSACTVDGFAFDLEALMTADKLGMSVSEIPVTIVNHRESHVNVILDTFCMLREVSVLRKRFK